MKKTGEYSTKGDYHKELDKKWKYLPVYLEKKRILGKILDKYKGLKILDAGCGEGVFVEEYRKRGYNIVGLDFNYKSKSVICGDIKKMPFKNQEFDVVLCLDVIEHINISEHAKVIKELTRVTKISGIIIFGLPNLAHIASRVSFALTGNLIRTSEVERHVGDRPILEYISLMKKSGLEIKKRIGLFPTFPIISLMTIKCPSKSIILHKIYNRLFANPGWCFENIIISKRVR